MDASLRWSLAPNARRSKQRCVQCSRNVHADVVAAERRGGVVVRRGKVGGGVCAVQAEEDGGVMVVIVLMQLGEGSASTSKQWGSD